MWAIAIKFLTGTCVTSDLSDRDAAEWPPHPFRVFMAMAAAHFETSRASDERSALSWLETLHPPHIHASNASCRSTVTTFVPVNDGKGAESLMTRSRQPRTFPTVIPERDTIYYAWPDTPELDAYRAALTRLLNNVSRIGHSSSMVQAWLVDSTTEVDVGDLDMWLPDEKDFSGRPMRRMFTGAIDLLESSFNEEKLDQYLNLCDQYRLATTKAKKELKARLDAEFASGAPSSKRPESKVVARYRKIESESRTSVPTVFDDQLLVFTQFDGPVLGCETTYRFTTAMRGAILSTFDSERSTPEWISGHQSDGKPTSDPHLAIMPLPFVDSIHADGHLLGLALVFPRTIPPRERGNALSRLMTDPSTGESRAVELRLGELGVVTLYLESRSVAPKALQGNTWTEPSKTWATVTPIVLDRYPKSDPHERAKWNHEVAEMIGKACQRIGLPLPTDIAVSHNAYLKGVPKARPRGGGFPAFPNRSGNGQRVMVHAIIAFEDFVQGPVLLGAGRFLGYGLCKPVVLEGNR